MVVPMLDPDTDPISDAAAEPGQVSGRGKAVRSPSGKFIKTPHFADIEIDTLLKHEPASLHHRRYQVEGLIGVGATGEVFAVQDGSLDRLVAVKLLRTELTRDSEDIRNFIEEARITAKLSHPNVLPVHDLNICEDGRPYFSMSRISGKTLGQALIESEKGVRPGVIATMNAIVNIFINICNAVNYAHHFGIIHQDIKPDNILLGDFGEILLLDWGSAARINAEAKVLTGIYGTPLYMSPEQARQEYSDVRSDIYCIGSALFHALLLRIPSWSDDGDKFWEMKQQGVINLPTAQERHRVPAELLAISRKALQADPLLRYQTVVELRRDLEQYQAGLAVSAHHDSLLRSLGRWYARNRQLTWLAMSGVLIVGMLLGALIRLQLKQHGAWFELFQERFDEASKGDLSKHWVVRTQNIYLGKPFQDVSIANAPQVMLLPNVLQITAQEEVVDLVYNQVIRGNFRVSWDVNEQQSRGNLNCFIGVNREVGFTFHVGGWGDPSSVVLTEGPNFERLQEARLPAPLATGMVYHMVLEREERHLRLWVNDHKYIDYIDAESIGGQQGQTFGFDCFNQNRMLFSNVNVYHQAVPQIISPVEVGDKLFMLGDWIEAERQYSELAEEYPDSEMELSCRYRIALCERQLDHLSSAGMQLDAFAASHPDSELAPYALYQRFRLAVGAGEERTMRRILVGMSHYRGNPVLGQILDDLGRYRMKAILPHKRGRELLGCEYPRDVARHIKQIMVELQYYSDSFGVSLDHNPFPKMGSLVLFFVGEYADSWKMVPWDANQHALSLMFLGNYHDALLLPCQPEVRAQALIYLGRLKEVATSREYPGDMRSKASLLLGDFQALKALDPNDPIAELALRQQGRFDAFLALHPTDSRGPDFGITEKLRVLVQMGRAQEALGYYVHGSARAFAFNALGRFDEAVSAANSDCVAVAQAAIGYMAQGKSDKAAPLVRALALQYGITNYNRGLFANKIMPEMISAMSGDRDSAAKMWREELATEPDMFGQAFKYLVRYVLGEIDDQEFQRQPCTLLLTVRLQEAQALREEYQGHARDAARIYQRILELDAWVSQLDDVSQSFMEWRVRAAGLTPRHQLGGNCLP